MFQIQHWNNYFQFWIVLPDLESNGGAGENNHSVCTMRDEGRSGTSKSGQGQQVALASLGAKGIGIAQPSVFAALFRAFSRGNGFFCLAVEAAGLRGEPVTSSAPIPQVYNGIVRGIEVDKANSEVDENDRCAPRNHGPVCPFFACSQGVPETPDNASTRRVLPNALKGRCVRKHSGNGAPSNSPPAARTATRWTAPSARILPFDPVHRAFGQRRPAFPPYGPFPIT